MEDDQRNTILYEKVFESDFLEIFTSNNGVVYTDWIGTITDEELMVGCEEMLKAAIDKDCVFLLNDNRKLSGGWAHMLQWVLEEFLPRFVENGLEKAAHIYSQDSQLFIDANAMFEHPLPMEAQLFKDYKAAAFWLTGQEMDPPMIHDRFTFRTSSGYKQVSAEKIIFFTRFDGHTLVQCVDSELSINLSLTELEEVLPKDSFYRIHKSYIVNIAQVDRLEYHAGGYYRAYFKEFGNTHAPVSKNAISELRAMLETDSHKPVK